MHFHEAAAPLSCKSNLANNSAEGRYLHIPGYAMFPIYTYWQTYLEYIRESKKIITMISAGGKERHVSTLAAQFPR
jgi:hypothetical protein